MTYAAAHAAIRTRFNDQWGHTPIQFPGEHEPNGKGREFVRLNISDSGAFHASIGSPGSNITRHTGTVVLQVHVPKGSGDGRVLELIDLARPIFLKWEHAETRLKFGRAAPYVRPGGPDAQWEIKNLNWPFERDTFE